MTAWWYLDNDRTVGPIDGDELRRLLQNGTIAPEALLWYEGMEAWQPLGKFPELQQSSSMDPSPLPAEASPDPQILLLAGRWPRFLARTLDMWWETFLVSFALGAVLGRYSVSFVRWINDTSASQFFGIICLPIALVFDALLYRALGNTPGKALLGLKVQTVDRKRLSFVQYLDRNVSIWVRGLALGLPPINLITMTNQFRRLGNGQQASYDESPMFRVFAQPLGWVGETAFGCIFAGVFAGTATLNYMERIAQREVRLHSSQESHSWENPVTRICATINSRWKCSAQTDDGSHVFTFSEPTDHAVVILGVEEAPEYSLAEYVRAFRKAATDMHFADDGRFTETDGFPSWQVSGNMVDGATNRLNVQVSQVRSAIWRTITIQIMPYAYSDPFVEDLKVALWTTIKQGTSADVAIHPVTNEERPE